MSVLTQQQIDDAVSYVENIDINTRGSMYEPYAQQLDSKVDQLVSAVEYLQQLVLIQQKQIELLRGLA